MDASPVAGRLSSLIPNPSSFPPGKFQKMWGYMLAMSEGFE